MDRPDPDDFSALFSSRRQRPFIPIALPSPMHREAAVYALRMIEGLRWHQRLWDGYRIRDRDVLRLMGLEQDDSLDAAPTLTDFRVALAARLRQLESRLRTGNDLLARNVARLGAVLHLGATEGAVLRLATIVARSHYFSDLFSQTIRIERDLHRAVQAATGCRLDSVRRALAEDRPLRRSGFIEKAHFTAGFLLELDDDIANGLLAQRFDEARLLQRLLRVAPPSTLTLADFTHLPDLELIQRYLRDAVKRRRKGVNLLLYGAPGTGKTEFARALAPALGVDLHEVPNGDGDGDPISGYARFSAYSVCQNILAHRRGQVLLFDEVEDVFGAGGDSSGALFAALREHNSPSRLRKSWINETLESNPVPALWICNSVAAMDPAFLRRFDLVVEFAAPSRAVRRRFIDNHFRPGEISPACASRLAGIEHLPPAQLERAARVVRSLRSRDQARRDAEVERVLMASLRAMGHRQAIPQPALPGHYDPAFLNADRDLDEIARGLGGHGARLCLYGPPGTGKTAFAHHLGQVLDRPVLVRRSSDLLDMFVGGTEEKICAAFAQARTDGAILVIDEADGFLRDRSGFDRSFEVTQVNELLTQMEAFDGIFVASTNLVDTLDEASLRRFDFKIRFDYLTREQRCAFLLRVVADANEPLEQVRPALARISRLEHITPGDFANVLRQLRVTGERPTAARVVQLLAAEATMKKPGRKQGIGFVRHD